jgi:hypothetical protein
MHHAFQLSMPEIKSRNGQSRVGWEIPLEVMEKSFKLILLVGDVFPFEPPMLYFKDIGLFFQFPHVEKNGKLCLTNSVTTFSPSRIIETADYLISQTKKLIIDSLTGKNEKDFVQEFQNYWCRQPSFSSAVYWTLITQLSKSSIVYYYQAATYILFGESEKEIHAWVMNFNGGILPKGFNTKPTAIIWLQKPLMPKQYPKTALDVLNLARDSTQDADVFLESVIPNEPSSLPILLGFETILGKVLAGVEIFEPKTAKIKKNTKPRNSRNDGFRHSQISTGVLLSRYFGGVKVIGHEVVPVDSSSCLLRGGVSKNIELQSKCVAIVGCGSLGAEVAMAMAKSGVGKLVLVDNDELKWGNIARHLLGSESVGTNKAKALTNLIARQLPWVSIITKADTLENLIYKHPETLQKCDLIISTTGDWTCDCTLNSALRTFAQFPPVLFGWTEPYGIAGHALAVFEHGGCLTCGTNEFGVFDSRITEWYEGQSPLVQATGCSDIYQPYGVMDVAPIKAIIAEAALDVIRGQINSSELRTWIGDTKRLHELGGQFGTMWRDKITPGESDKRIFTKTWLVNKNCPLCK